MDLLRAAIKALYYNYPIENAYGMIIGGETVKHFLGHYNHLASLEDDGFTQREMTAYKDYLLETLQEKWGQREGKIKQIVTLPLEFAGEVLSKDEKDYPCVKFEHLFRWREVVKGIGEDVFTTAYLAKEDKKFRKDFFWPNVIGHNEDKVNTLLNTGLSDIHAHFGGSIDAFQFTWVCLMNDIEKLKSRFDKLQFSLNDVVAFDKEYSFKNLSKWCRLAAAIRVRLFKLLIKKQDLNSQTEIATIQKICNCSGDEEATSLKEDIDSLRCDAKRTREGVKLDYAIDENLITEEYITTPYFIYAGERQLEYAFFRDFKQRKPLILKGTWPELFYLYEVIKTHVRREFVFANEMFGFDSFTSFTSRSEIFTKEIEAICNISSVQTSMRADKKDCLESRITYGSWSLPKGEYWKGLFSEENFLKEEEMKKRLTFVVQLTKGCKKGNEHIEGRYRRKKAEVRKELETLTNYIDSGVSYYDIVGIDAGGMELYYRPEVYGHVMRAGKEHGLNVTYHVGEEFYDLADGLRAIWEIIEFAKIGRNDRLGHCLALGVQPRDYYRRKHCTLTMPKQIMLDNMVWLMGIVRQQGILLKSTQKKELLDIAADLYKELGYERYIAKLNIEDYFDSMYLRSDEDNEDDGLDVWSLTAELDSAPAKKARANANALTLFKAYMHDAKLIEKGEKPYTKHFDNEYVKLIMKIQIKMIWKVIDTGVCIETCPSSNLQIGKLGRYAYHPSVKFYLNPLSKNKVLNFAVCTDDKGTFSTSLTNEFSLLALAATKGKGWNKGLEKDFKQLILQGNKYRFEKIASYED